MKIIFRLALAFALFAPLLAKPEWANITVRDRINSILIDNHIMWAATEGGITSYDLSNNYKATYYDKANAALPDNFITSLAKDSSGRLWMAGGNFGIGVMENYVTKVYNTLNSDLPANWANANMVIAKDGSLWFSSGLNLAHYDGINWRTWTLGNPIMSDNGVNGLAFDKNDKLWIAGSWGLATLESDTIRYIPEINFRINALAFDSKGDLWMGSKGKGLIRKKEDQYTYFDTLNSEAPDNLIITLSVDGEDNIWFSSGYGLTKFSPASAVSYSYDSIGAPDQYISSIAFYNNIVYLGTINGIVIHDGNSFSSLELEDNILGDNYVADIEIGSPGNIYLATSNVCEIKTDFDWNEIAPSEKYDFYNSLYAAKDGALWIGRFFSAFSDRDSSVMYYKDGVPHAFNKQETTAATHTVNKILEDEMGAVWIGTEGGLFRFVNNQWTEFNKSNSQLTTNNIRDLVIDNNGALWGTCGNDFGANNGCVFKYDGTNWQIFQNVSPTVRSNFFDAIAVDSKNNIWTTARDSSNIVGYEYGEGLLRFNGSNWSHINIYNSPLSSNTIFDIYIDKGDIVWIGTLAGGLVRYDSQGDWMTFNAFNSGLSNNIINVIKEDKEGKLWIGHNRGGVSVFDKTTLAVQASEALKVAALKLYPSPASNILFVKVFDETLVDRAGNYKIYGESGELFKSGKLQAGNENAVYEIKIDDLQSGAYFLVLDFGNRKVTQKFVVQK